MYDLISQGHLSLNRVNTLILDEADRMLDMGFNQDIEGILDRIKIPKSLSELGVPEDCYSLVHNAIRISNIS